MIRCHFPQLFIHPMGKKRDATGFGKTYTGLNSLLQHPRRTSIIVSASSYVTTTNVLPILYF